MEIAAPDLFRHVNNSKNRTLHRYLARRLSCQQRLYYHFQLYFVSVTHHNFTYSSLFREKGGVMAYAIYQSIH